MKREHPGTWIRGLVKVARTFNPWMIAVRETLCFKLKYLQYLSKIPARYSKLHIDVSTFFIIHVSWEKIIVFLCHSATYVFTLFYKYTMSISISILYTYLVISFYPLFFFFGKQVTCVKSLPCDDNDYYDTPARPPTDRAVADRNILFVRSRDMRETFTTIINRKCCAKSK